MPGRTSMVGLNRRVWRVALAALTSLVLGTLPSTPAGASTPTSSTSGGTNSAAAVRHRLPPKIAAPTSRPTAPVASLRRLSLPGGVGANVQVSPADLNSYSSTTVAADPAADGSLFVATNTLTKPPVATARSADSGASWSGGTLPLPPNPPDTYAFYPAPTFDASGYLYQASMPYLVTSNGFINSQLPVYRSIDRGATWTGPYQVESIRAGAEKPLMAADNSSGSFRNRLYVAYDTNPRFGSEPLVVARSDDGEIWQKTSVFDSGGDFGAFPAIGPSGEVYVIWDDYCGGVSTGSGCSKSLGRIVVAKSTNGGASFDALGGAPTLLANTSVGFGAVLPNWSNSCGGAGPITVNPAPAIDVDRTSGSHHGSVYAVWGDESSSGTPMHIRFSRSTDGGAHWSSAVQLDTGNRRDAWEPTLSVDQSTGNVTVAWYQRDDPKLYRVFYTQSTDGGQTFLPVAIPVADALSDPTLNCAGTGYAMEMIAVNGVAHPVWTDTRNGIPQIFTTSVTEAAFLPISGIARLAAATDWPAGSGPTAPVVADFNGDGKPDVAVANNGGVSVLLGNGDGTFRAPIFTTAPTGTAMAVGDFNMDGKPDLAVANQYSGSISILLGKGDGSFQAPATYDVPQAALAIAVGDLNGDGKADVVVESGNYAAGPRISVLLGNGDGTMQAAKITAQLDSTGQSAALALGDFNGDGHVDVAVPLYNSSVFSNNIAILLGNGDGTLSSPSPSNSFNGGADWRAQSLVAGDFNKDGKPDLAVTSLAGGNSLAVLINNSTGPGVLSFTTTATYAAPQGPIAVGDFNGDGRSDLAVGGTASLSGVVSILISNADGTLKAGIGSAVGASPAWLAPGDFNRDGKLDLAIASQFGLSIAIGAGNGRLQTQVNYPVGGQPFVVATGDFNKDGKLDVVTNGNGNLVVLPGNGDGTFGAAINSPLTGQPQSISVADLNGDSKLDVVIADNLGGLTVSLGNGDGTFGAATTYTTPVALGGLAVADFNGDGKLDIAVAGSRLSGSTQYGVVSVYLGTGVGTFLAPVDFQVGSISGGSLVAADFNIDGKMDIAVSVGGPTVGPNAVAVFLNTSASGTLSFAPAVQYGTSSGALAVGDFNGDGKLDIVNANQNGLFILFGNGDATFRVTGPLGSLTGARLVVGDMNGDGKQDLVVAGGGTALGVLLGDGSGMLSPPAWYEADQNLMGLTAAEFDGDGTLDLAVANTNSNDVSILLGTAPAVTLSPQAFSFGSQAVGTTSAPQPITVTNTGPWDLHVQAVQLTGVNSGDFALSADSCSGVLVLGGHNCSVSVTFTPSVAGTRFGGLNVVDDGRASPQTASWFGPGTGPGVSLTPPSVIFDDQVLGTTSASQTVTLTNSGTTTLQMTSLTPGGPNAADFTLAPGTCAAATLLNGRTCTFTVAFSPTVAGGRRSATISLVDNSLPGPQTLPLTGLATHAASTAPSTLQYGLTGSDGGTWVDLDPDTLTLDVTATANGWAIINGNADLWTANAGYNQDLGIAVWGGAYPTVRGQPEAWKESGGFAGTFSPNAAEVQAALPVVAGTTYVIRLDWKTSRADPGTIFAGAGPIAGQYSPTRLSVELVSNSANLLSAVSTNQYQLTSNDGVSWATMDSTNLQVTVGPGVTKSALLGANADLWTANAGYNQDIAIFVSVSGAADQLVAWKESGGFAGTFSPNAAFVQAVYNVSAGNTYVFKLKWKAHKNAAGATIFAGAGPIAGRYSPTRLIAELVPGASSLNSVSTQQYSLADNNGMNWVEIDSANLEVTVAPSSNAIAVLGANADLWTANAGYNQDIAIFVSVSGAADQLVGWKESGGFAGTFSPNAAFVQAVYNMGAGSTYIFKLKWKAHKNAAGAIIFAGAGPIAGNYSPTSLVMHEVS